MSRETEVESDMISRMLKATAAYVESNYGRGEIADACRRGNAAAFMAATKWVTENRDAKLAGIQNRIICAGIA